MKNIRLICLSLITVFFASGCATAIKYSYGGKLFKTKEPSGLNVVVDRIQDLRTEDEHDGTFSTTKGFLYTKDKMFKKDIESQVTKVLVNHLKKSKLFGNVSSQDIPEDLLAQSDEMGKLSTQGVDLVIQSDLHHFYGYQSNSSALGVVLVGVLGEAMFNKKVVGGKAAYGDIQVINVKNGTLLWEGNLEHEFEDKETFYDGAPQYAIQALKIVNDQLTKQLDIVRNTVHE